MEDVGRSKAQVAAEFVMKRVPGCSVSYFVGAIQEKDASFYRQFQVVVSGLDNIEARRWLNRSGYSHPYPHPHLIPTLSISNRPAR